MVPLEQLDEAVIELERHHDNGLLQRILSR